MKKEYLEFELDIVWLNNLDIITESKDSDVTDDPFVPGEEWW
jgi:hypothetical protein